MTRPSPSVFRVVDDWYIACRSEDLRRQPLQISLYEVPLVLFRGEDGRVGAMLDRCPHRNAPLSLGRVRGQTIECAYHGWRFDVDGKCRLAAGIRPDAIVAACHATPYATKEQQGFVWVYASQGRQAATMPFEFPFLEDHRYRTDQVVLEAAGSVFAVAENSLDVPHTAYLHGGLFRSASREPAEIGFVIRRIGSTVEAEYTGEPRPSGLAGKILAPGGGNVVHFDRFILPSITQVEYRIGDRTHVVVTVAMTPLEEFRTRLFAVVSFRLPLPAWSVSPFLRPLLLRIFRQDAFILAKQTDVINRFGGEQFVSTEADTLGPHIHRMLKMAELGERTHDATPVEVRRGRVYL